MNIHDKATAGQWSNGRWTGYACGGRSLCGGRFGVDRETGDPGIVYILRRWNAIVVVRWVLLVHWQALVVGTVDLDEDCSAFDTFAIWGVCSPGPALIRCRVEAERTI